MCSTISGNGMLNIDPCGSSLRDCRCLCAAFACPCWWGVEMTRRLLERAVEVLRAVEALRTAAARRAVPVRAAQGRRAAQAPLIAPARRAAPARRVAQAQEAAAQLVPRAGPPGTRQTRAQVGGRVPARDKPSSASSSPVYERCWPRPGRASRKVLAAISRMARPVTELVFVVPTSSARPSPRMQCRALAASLGAPS